MNKEFEKGFFGESIKEGFFKGLFMGLPIGAILLGLLLIIFPPYPASAKTIDEIQDTVNFGRQEIKIDFSDEDTNEQWAIKTDSQNYFSFGGGAVFYMSVTNLSGIAQSATTVFLPDQFQQIKSVKRFDGNVYQENYEYFPKSPTSTAIFSEKLVPKFTELTLSNTYTPLGYERKETDGIPIQNGFTDFYEIGETKYYKAIINIPSNTKNAKWYIETFGNTYGYGHLDPVSWTYEQDFESFDLGDLDTQGIWDWGEGAVFNVISGTPDTETCTGSKSIKGTTAGSNSAYIATLPTAPTNGTIWFAMKSSVTNQHSFMYFRQTATPEELSVRMANDGWIRFADYDPVFDVAVYEYSANTWYIFKLVFDLDTTDTATLYVYDSDGVALANSGSQSVQADLTEITDIRAWASATAHDIYYDSFQTTEISECASVDAPVASFTGTPRTGQAPQEVSFTDTSTNSPTSWYWTFGDGNSTTTQNPSHTYSENGTYDVSLGATNAGGTNTSTEVGYIVFATTTTSTVIGASLSRFLDDGNFQNVLIYTLAGLLFLSFLYGLWIIINAFRKLL